MSSSQLPRVFFLIQKFESKPRLQDSAGYLEVAAPLVASGVVGATQIYDFGKSLAYYDELVHARIAELKTQIGEAPVVVYGAGAHTERYLDAFRQLNFQALSDSSESLWGKRRYGMEIIQPDAIPDVASHVVVSTRVFESSVMKTLSRTMPEGVKVHALYEPMQQREREWREQHLEEAEQLIREFSPDILFYTPSHPAERVSEEWFIRLKRAVPKMRIVVIWWDYDEQTADNPYLKFERESLRYGDVVIDMHGLRRERMLRREGLYRDHANVERLLYLHCSNDPAIFHPGDAEKDIDIAIFGSRVGKRSEWIDRLQQRYGDKFLHVGGVYSDVQPLEIEEYAELLRKTKIVINTQTYPFRQQCKGKVKETLACGAMLLEEDNDETRMLCGDEGALVYFSDFDELTAKIDYYLSNDSEREKIALEGRLLFQKELSPRVWAERLLAVVNAVDERNGERISVL